jgi:hypothetical protein
MLMPHYVGDLLDVIDACEDDCRHKTKASLFGFPRSDEAKEKAHQRLISDGLFCFVQQITEW